MSGISHATSAVKAIFSLDVITAGLAFVCFITATALVLTRLKNGRVRSFDSKKHASDIGPMKTTLSTHLFLIPALLFLVVAYAIQSAVVSLQADVGSAATVTSAFDYNYAREVSASSIGTAHGQTISILSFVEALAAILFTFALTGAVWLHSNNLTSNGTQVNSPGTISKLWNAFILASTLAFGLASWGESISIRGSGNGSQSYPSTIDNDRITRILFIVFRCVVIFASTSVTVEVILNYVNLMSNGLPGNAERPLLSRFTYITVPTIWLRNAFIVVNIVLIYKDVTLWSNTNNQAIAFLLVIFGQLADLLILFMVLWGAWSMGRSAGNRRLMRSSS